MAEVCPDCGRVAGKWEGCPRQGSLKCQALAVEYLHSQLATAQAELAESTGQMEEARRGLAIANAAIDAARDVRDRDPGDDEDWSEFHRVLADGTKPKETTALKALDDKGEG